MGIFHKFRIDELDVKLSREDLLRRSRILVIDDERPELIDDLSRARFAVDYQPDITKENMDVIDRPTYDLVILDFGEVGAAFGADQGLSLLRHIKRVNPSVVVLAYTSKALKTEHADFYRLADAVLQKDAGIAESMEKIEEALKKALCVKNLWAGILNVANIQPGSREDLELQDLFVKGINKPGKMNAFRGKVTAILRSEAAQKVGLVILEKLIEIGIKAAMGGA